MNQGIVIDIGARIVGYEDSLKKLKEALNNIDINSKIGKTISKEIEQAEQAVKNLNKNLTPKVTSNSQLDNLIEKYNSVGDLIETIGQKIQKVNLGDLDFKNNTGIQNLTSQLQELEQQLSGKINSSMQELISNSTLS